MAEAPAVTATLNRRVISLIYESLILLALVLMAGLLAIWFTKGLPPEISRNVLRVWLLLICGCFYTWQWTHHGQTLPMKTWKIKVVTREGKPLALQKAWLRYLALLGSVAILGVGFFWAVFDRDRQFLHDRMAGTRLIAV